MKDTRSSIRNQSIRNQAGQTTAEYALVIMGAAAIAALVIVWATHSHAIGHLFDVIVGNVTKNAS